MWFGSALRNKIQIKNLFGKGGGLAAFFVLLVLLWGAIAAVGDAKGDFTVKSFSPQGGVQNVREIEVLFSRAAVSKQDVGRELSRTEMPLDFTPYLEGRGRWLSPERFVFTPKKASLAEATAYRVELFSHLSDPDGNLLKGRRVFEFSTAPLRFLGVRQVDFEPYSERTVYTLSFSAPVSPRKLYGFLDIRDAEGNRLPFDLQESGPSTRLTLYVAPRSETFTLKIAKGLPPEVGPLGLEQEVSVPLTRNLNMEVTQAFARSELGNMRVEISTTAPVDLQKAKAFIELVPPAEFELVSDTPGTVSITAAFQPRDIVRVKVLKGFPSMGKSVSKETWETVLTFPDLEPSFRFLTTGRTAPASDVLRLPIEIVNCDTLNVSVSRVYNNNLPLVARRYWPDEASDYSETITEKQFATKSKPNEIIQRALDLKKIVGERRGLFAVSLSTPGQEWSQTSQLFNITDIGVSANLYDSGAFFWLNSLATGKAIQGGKVSLWSDKNQLLAEGVTDAQGIAHIAAKEAWKAGSRPTLATVEKGEDCALVRFESNLFDNSDFEVGGPAYVQQGYEAFCFTPRGVFRPGERVPLRVIVRDSLKKTPLPFPLVIKTTGPDGRVWKSSSVKLSSSGSAESVLLLSPAAPTGSWRMGVYLPGGRSPIGETSFYVEEYAIPRLKVALSADKKRLHAGQQAQLDVSAEYLFGGAGAGLSYEVRLTAQPEDFSHKEWKGFVFGDSRVSFSSESNLIAGGELDAAGRTQVALKSQKWDPPSILRLIYQVGVMEEGGRWNYSSLAIPFFPKNTLLGINPPSDTLLKGESTPFEFAAVTADAKGASLAKASVTTYKINYVPTVYAESNGGSGRMDEEYVQESQQTVAFNKGAAKGNLVFKSNGEYLVVVEAAGASTACLRVYSFDSRWTGEVGATLPDKVRILLDKPQYKVGETVTARVSAPLSGRVLLTVATDKIIQSEVREIRSEDVLLKFKVTQEMSPNAWVTAVVVGGGEQSGARALGVVPLKLDHGRSNLQIQLKGAKRLKPSAKNDFSVQLTDSSGKGVRGEVTVMLVDSGVLALTRFPTPSPWDFFFQRRGLGVSIYDVYSSLLSMAGKETPLLVPGGGDDALMDAAKVAAPTSLRAQRFKTLSLIKTISTDAKGRADFSFVIPEFSGEGRLMAVAHSGALFGSAAEEFPILRDLVVESALPRALAPGDRFTSSLQLFNQGEAKSVTAELTVQTEGPLLLSSATEKLSRKVVQRVTIKQGEALRVPLRFSVADSGVAKVRTTLSWAGGSSTESIEIPSRPPYPRMSQRLFKVLAPGKKISYPGLAHWLPGSVCRSVTLSGQPKARLADLAKFLVDYPYGCLEQTVSGGWALLAQPELVGQLNPSLAGKYEMRSALAERMRRIQSLQLYSGGFADWPGWMEESRWNSIYTAHFLVASAKRGVPVPKETQGNALAYLRRLVSSLPDGRRSSQELATEFGAQAYAAYVLALNGEAPLGWMGYLKDQAKNMPSSGRILLAAAYAKGGQQELASQLLGAPSLVQKTGAVRAHAENLDSDIRTAALTLLAWSAVDPLGAESATAVVALQALLDKGNAHTTQNAAFALFSLSDYFSHRGKGEGEPELVVEDAAGHVLTSLKGSALLTLPAEKTTPPLTVRNTGKGDGFVSITETGVPLKQPAAQDKGIVARQKFTDEEGKTLDLARPILKGQRLYGVVSLKPTGGAIRQIVLSALLPAGFEIENARLVEQLKAQNGKGVAGHIRIEERDDRLLLFIEELEEAVEWSYAVRAVTAGSFVLPPIHAEAMYDPGIFSLGASGRVVIEER